MPITIQVLRRRPGRRAFIALLALPCFGVEECADPPDDRFAVNALTVGGTYAPI